MFFTTVVCVHTQTHSLLFYWVGKLPPKLMLFRKIIVNDCYHHTEHINIPQCIIPTKCTISDT